MKQIVATMADRPYAGTADLLRAGGHYYRLYTQQFRRQLEQEYDVFKTHTLAPVAAQATPAPAMSGRMGRVIVHGL